MLINLLMDSNLMKNSHWRFKQAQLKMCHSPKVEDIVEKQIFHFLHLKF